MDSGLEQCQMMPPCSPSPSDWQPSQGKPPPKGASWSLPLHPMAGQDPQVGSGCQGAGMAEK